MCNINQKRQPYHKNKLNSIGLYHENAIAIENEACDPNSGNMCLFLAATMQLTFLQAAFARKERNLHCDVHVAAEN